jgi:peptidyl-prolyl cis-trans isomerase B (cyclophilin B)
VTSLKDRQRAAARAKLEREMATRLEQAAHRRQRRLWSASIAVAVIVVAGLVTLLITTGGDNKAKTPTASASSVGPAKCVWTPNPNPSPSPVPSVTPSPNKDLTKTGMPPTTDIPNKGTRDFVLDTNQGKITIALDLAKAPCASASLAYLSDQKFYDKTDCGNLISSGPHILICGDPTDHGDGGPSYTYATENLPTDQRPNYSEGVVAMLNDGKNNNGSQFMIFYGDDPVQTDPSSGTESPAVPSNFTIVGTVTSGLDIVAKVGAAGAEAQNKYGAYKPKLPLDINSTSVGTVNTSAS